MIFSRFQLRLWGIEAKGVLHVGAHEGEERDFYKAENFGKVIWVEAQPKLIPKLQELIAGSGDTVLEAVVWDISGASLKLKIASNSQSTSVLNFGSHAERYPEITFVSELDVTTTRLDELLGNDYEFNFVNLDIQGAELRALKGLGNLLDEVKYIYTEVNSNEVYEGCCTVDELDGWLLTKGFQRVATRWVKEGWGDALYLRKEEISDPTYRLAKRKLLFSLASLLEKCRSVIGLLPSRLIPRRSR